MYEEELDPFPNRTGLKAEQVWIDAASRVMAGLYSFEPMMNIPAGELAEIAGEAADALIKEWAERRKTGKGRP